MVNLTTKNNHHIVQLANYEIIRVTSRSMGHSNSGSLSRSLYQHMHLSRAERVNNLTSTRLFTSYIILWLERGLLKTRWRHCENCELHEPPYSLYILMSSVFSTTWQWSQLLCFKMVMAISSQEQTDTLQRSSTLNVTVSSRWQSSSSMTTPPPPLWHTSLLWHDFFSIFFNNR